MAVHIQLRRGTAAEWSAANPTLAIAELGIETDTAKHKIGTGVLPWNSLPYGGITGTPGPAGPPGPPGGIAAVDQVISLELASSPKKLYWVYGDSSDGGTTPDTATQVSINALLTAGVPSNNIRWLYETGGSLFVIDSLRGASKVDSITLYQGTGSFSIQGITGASLINNVILVQSGGTFSMASLLGASKIDNISLTQAGSYFLPQNMTSASTMDGNITLVFSGGIFAMGGLTGASTIFNITGTISPTQPVISVTPGNTTNVIALTSGGTGATSYDVYWDTSSHASQMTTNANHITGVTLPYTHTGRTNGTTYYYSLVAINTAGSIESSEVSGFCAAPISDTFTQSDNAAPDSSIWATANASLAASCALNIQTGRLRAHIKSASGLANYNLTTQNAVNVANNLIAKCDYYAIDSGTAALKYLYLAVWNSSGGDITHNSIFLSLYIDAGAWHYELYYGNSGGSLTSLGTFSGGGQTGTWKIKFPTASTVEVYKDDTLKLGPLSHGANLGTSVKGHLFISTGTTLSFEDYHYDNFYLGL